MQHKISSIEDCIHSLSDKTYTGIDFGIKLPQDQILLSMSRQLRRKVALTDKQYYLAKDKIEKYRDVFEKNGIRNLDEILETINIPLRSVDRSKCISIVDRSDFKADAKPNSYLHRTWIKVRFPFNKKTIAKLSEIATQSTPREGNYYHERQSHEHYLKFSEATVEKLVEVFSKKEFQIDEQILEIYERIQNIKSHPELYVPGIFKDQVKNIPDAAMNRITEELGDITYHTRLVYRDRAIRYGLSHFDYEIPGHTLAEKIALRPDPEVLVDPNVSLDRIVSALHDLKRTPVLVLINDLKRDEEALEELKKLHVEFSKFYGSNEQTVLFRVDSVPNVYTVNDYVKEHGLNSWVDEKTKVVYIKKSRLPKLMHTGPWKPITSISLTSDNSNTMVKDFIKTQCDLVLYQDTYISSMGKLYKKDNVYAIV
jgi:hypothetical protein